MQSPESPDLDFHKLWLVLKRRWLAGMGVFVVLVGLTIPVAVMKMQKTAYEAEGKLLFKVNRTSALTGVGGQEIGEFTPLTTNSNPISTEIEIIRSIPLVKETIASLHLIDKDGMPLEPEDLLDQLKVSNLGATDVLELSYKSTEPEEAAAVVNKLMTLYIQNNVHTNRAEVVAAQEFIAKQLPKAEANVNQAEAELRTFKEANHVIALDEEAKVAVETVATLDEQITQVQAQFKDATAESLALQNKVGMTSEQAIAVNSLNQSQGVQDVLKQFQQVEAQLSVERTRFLDSNPIIINLQEKKAALETLLQDRIDETVGTQRQIALGKLQLGEFKQQLTADLVKAEVRRLGLANQLTQLSNNRSSYKQRLNILPKLEKDQRELQRRLDAAQSTYETLLKKLQELRVAENQTIGNARIIEPADVPDERSPRQAILIIFLGGVMGILLGMATIITLEVRDTSLKTLKEIQEVFGYPLLSTLPTLGKKSYSRTKPQERTVPELPVRDNPLAPMSEVYRMLHANLKFLSSDKPPQVILVTSSVPQEGKSTISANLAAAIAQLGRRVLLVDGDLRHPLQHHIWQLTNVAGLSDVLVMQAQFEAVVNKVMDNLDVLTCGVIPPNPLALLDSKRMASLIEYFSEHYHFVIIDSPPLVMAADALTLGKMTDGVLLISRPKIVDSISAIRSKELLERSGQNVLGLVVNGVKLDNQSDRYFHYYTTGYSSQQAIINSGKSSSLN